MVAGLVLITMGTLFLLAENGIFNWREVWRFWPVVLIIAGIADSCG